MVLIRDSPIFSINIINDEHNHSVTFENDITHMRPTIKNSPIVTFTPGLIVCDKCDNDWECSLCLNKDADIPTCVKTSCGHVFHQTCMKKLKDSQPQPNDNLGVVVPCPLCRKNLYIA
jgi:E3 ubiquitin-protein ligase MYCBP2